MKKEKSPWEGLFYLCLIAIIVGGLIYITIPRIGPIVAEPVMDNSAALLITMNGWEPSSFRAKAGSPITITLRTLASEANHPDNVHSFVLDQTGTDVRLLAGQSKSFQLSLPGPGVYTFWCVTCCGGRASPNMAGTIIAEA